MIFSGLFGRIVVIFFIFEQLKSKVRAQFSLKCLKPSNVLPGLMNINANVLMYSFQLPVLPCRLTKDCVILSKDCVVGPLTRILTSAGRYTAPAKAPPWVKVKISPWAQTVSFTQTFTHCVHKYTHICMHREVVMPVGFCLFLCMETHCIYTTNIVVGFFLHYIILHYIKLYHIIIWGNS